MSSIYSSIGNAWHGKKPVHVHLSLSIAMPPFTSEIAPGHQLVSSSGLELFCTPQLFHIKITSTSRKINKKLCIQLVCYKKNVAITWSWERQTVRVYDGASVRWTVRVYDGASVFQIDN